MIVTLAINHTKYTNSLYTKLEKAIGFIQESEYMDADNINKLHEYLATKEQFEGFKFEFAEISDEEKNDCLYFDIHELINNQYLVHVTFKPISGDPNKAAFEAYDKLITNKISRRVAHNTLTKRLTKLVLNYRLYKKTNPYKLGHGIKFSELNWLSKLDKEDVVDILKLFSQNKQFLNTLRKSEDTMFTLYNIFNK